VLIERRARGACRNASRCRAFRSATYRESNEGSRRLIKARVVFERRCLLTFLAASGMARAGWRARTGAVAVERAARSSYCTGRRAGKDGYVVKKGDTLHSIALDHGLDYRELIAWNTIENPNRILVGQSLRVRAPGSPAAERDVVVRPVTAGSRRSSSAPLGTVSPAATAVRRAARQAFEPPLAGKEPYSEQALARAQAQAVEPVIGRAGREAQSRAGSEAGGQTGPQAGSGRHAARRRRRDRLDLAGQRQD
jgi:LysM repeat protein